MIVLVLAGCHGPEDTDAIAASAVADAGPDVVAEVGQAVTLDGSASIGVAFRWDFGDGATADGAAAAHAWSEPGTWVAVLEVTGEDGATRTDSARVIVHEPLADPPPVASGTMAVDGDRVWAVTPESGVVAVADADGATFVDVCAAPRTVAIAGDDVAIACEDDALVILDRTTLALADRIALPAGSRPWGVVGRGGTWWVSLTGTGEVAEVVGGDVVRHAVGPDPRALALAPDGAVYAARFRSADDAGAVYIVGEGTIPLAKVGGTDSDTTSRGVPSLLGAVAIAPDGLGLWAGGLVANVDRGPVRDGQALTFETTVRALVVGVDLASGAEDDGARKVFDNQGLADPLAFAPLGDIVYVAHPWTRTVHALDRWNGDLRGSIHEAGQGIAGLGTSADGRVLYVHAGLDREVRAYDVTDLSRPPTLVWSAPTVGAEPLPDDVLRGKRLFHDALDRRMARDGYVTCAACHPDGQHDGRTWDFTDRGEGLRNTITLEGRVGTAMGPVHWTGNFDEIQDFENDIRHAFGGEGFLTPEDWAVCEPTLGEPKAGRDADLDALAAYVATLDATPASPFAGDADGEALFAASGCGDCHAGASFTDSDLGTFVRHDVGTWLETSGGRLGGAYDGFDTPTLLGAWATAPYLHDGRAATVEDAIRAHQGVELDDAAVRAVADYVRSL